MSAELLTAAAPLLDRLHQMLRTDPKLRQEVSAFVRTLAAWSDEQVDAYIAEHAVLVNPLLGEEYPSIGCEPCTRRIQPGADARSGRWAGLAKTECGIPT